MPQDPAQIATLESPDGRRRAPFLDIGGIVGSIAIREAVGEYMVKNGVLNPVRSCHVFITLQCWIFKEEFYREGTRKRRRTDGTSHLRSPGWLYGLPNSYPPI